MRPLFRSDLPELKGNVIMNRRWMNAGVFSCFMLSCISAAGGQSPDIKQTPTPAYLFVDMKPSEIASMKPADRRAAARALGQRLLSKRSNNPTRAIAIRLRNAPVSYDSLSRVQRSAFEAALPPEIPRTRRRMRLIYETELADILARTLAFTDRQDPDGRYGIYGLPVETVLGSYDLGAECNARHEHVIELMEVLVSARSFLLYGSSSTEWDTARRGIQECIRLRRDDQPLMFQTDGIWRIAFDGSRGGQDSGQGDNNTGGDGGNDGANPAGPIDAGRQLSVAGLRERSERQNPDPQPREYTFHWSVTGEYSSSIDTSAFPIEHDTVLFYSYMLGAVPRIVHDEVFFGGAPQRGDLQLHLSMLERDIDEYIPDPDWDGYAVIDYEAWPPYWERVSEAIKEISREIVRQNHPEMSRDEVEARAKIEFEDAAREFLLATITRCKEIRPNAKWGYFLWQPYFANGGPAIESFDWLWNETDAFYPSVYPTRFSVDGTPVNDWQARWNHYELKFSNRVYALRQHVGPEKPIFAYIQRKYMNWNQRYGGHPMNDIDLETAIYAPRRMEADGAMIWETLKDQDTADAFTEYLNNEMGPRMIDLLADQ